MVSGFSIWSAPQFQESCQRNNDIQGWKRIGHHCIGKTKAQHQSLKVAELAGVDCVPPLAQWAPPFLKEQGCDVKENTIKQDDKSAVLSENDRQVSSGKQTHAIDVCCFCVMDQIKWGNVSIQHCNTDKMMSDCMSKGPQGIKFHMFCHQIMGFSSEEPK